MRATRGTAAASSSSSLPRKTSAASSPSGLQGLAAPADAAALSSTSSSLSSPSPSAPAAYGTATTGGPAAPSSRLGGSPLVLAPVSQVSRTPRRTSRPELSLTAAEKAARQYDPDHYNPDGSLKTMHRLPHFEQSYAQAMQTRYIRHNRPIEREQELTVQQIFDKK